MPSKISAPALSARLTIACLIGFVVAVGSLVAFAYWAMVAVDTLALERQAKFAASGLQAAVERIPREQESITVWDDAVLRARAGDQEWMRENVGEWVGSYFGHDSVYVLDATDAAVHAMQDGITVPAQRYADDAALVRPLVAELRTAMANASAGLDDSTAAVAALGTLDVAMRETGPAAISVKPIVPSSERVALRPGTEYLHVSIRNIEGSVLEEIAAQYDLAGLHVLAEGERRDTRTSVPIASASGQVFGFLGWEGDRPGTSLIRSAAPGLGIGILVGGALLVWLLTRLRRSSTELHASETQAQFLAFHDTLTGLPNRALFEDRLDRALSAARRSGKKVALHAIDIDRFKNINDTRGHPAGDELIRLVATRLSSVFRDTDTVARLGGDEFVVVQTDVRAIADAEGAAERALAAISGSFDLLGERANVSGSIGVVLSNGGETNRHEMLRQADIALYEAKGRGRARYEVFASDMDDLVKRRRLIEEELRLALELGDQLKLVYQPLFAADGTTMLGAEALVRWNHPIHGMMAPELFIGIAEERALIEPLGEFVLREAASFARRADLPWVAVNVSPIQFRNDAFAARVLAILAEVGLPPNRLQIEITEGVLLENAGLIESTLGQLRAAGVCIALDDFGTGYSSMSYLRRYAIDKLKIDRSFVAELGSSFDADAIVRAMIGLARSLKLQVTAEGVETAEQRDHLVAIGCHELQGYLLSRPVGEGQILDLLGAAAAPVAKRA